MFSGVETEEFVYSMSCEKGQPLHSSHFSLSRAAAAHCKALKRMTGDRPLPLSVVRAANKYG